MAVLGSTSLTGCNSIPAFIAAGTVAVFRQSSAPSSWTKDTSSNNNRCLRCVTGTASSGGNVAFTTAFAQKGVSGNVSTNVSTNVSVSVGNHTLSNAQLPLHSHPNGATGNQSTKMTQPNDNSVNKTSSATTGNVGSNGAHNHPGSGNASSNASSNFSGSSIDLRVQYVDVIQCTKN